jgi:nucleoid DNA-binding protein
MKEVKKNYDTTDLVNELEAQTNLNPDIIREMLGHLWANIAKRVGAAKNPVILKDVGTFKIVGRSARNRTTPNGKVVYVPKHEKFQFHPAKAFLEEIQKNLREEVKDLPVK